MKKALFRQKYAVDEEKEIKVVNSKVEKVEEPEEVEEEVKEEKKEAKKKNGRKFAI